MRRRCDSDEDAVSWHPRATRKRARVCYEELSDEGVFSAESDVQKQASSSVRIQSPNRARQRRQAAWGSSPSRRALRGQSIEPVCLVSLPRALRSQQSRPTTPPPPDVPSPRRQGSKRSPLPRQRNPGREDSRAPEESEASEEAASDHNKHKPGNRDEDGDEEDAQGEKEEEEEEEEEDNDVAFVQREDDTDEEESDGEHDDDADGMLSGEVQERRRTRRSTRAHDLLQASSSHPDDSDSESDTDHPKSNLANRKQEAALTASVVGPYALRRRPATPSGPLMEQSVNRPLSKRSSRGSTVRRYELRKRQHKPQAQAFWERAFEKRARVKGDFHDTYKRHKRRRMGFDSDSDSDVDDKRHRGFNKRGDRESALNLEPMKPDPSVTFESVGGLPHHIDRLKEMVIFPLLYPEVFERLDIKPPRGVIFHGPPGTGKTLMARALANTRTPSGEYISFFMRKGADVLSKFVGEAERNLRLLFQEAKKRQPSIIFFDEIDGLAPARNSRQDYVYTSIVSTLLALMDGIDSRGRVIVIGATNRVDTVDAALRRPGRFDRELLFPLPNHEGRRHILRLHTKNFTPPLDPRVVDRIADQCVGYCGADLQALCSEAALISLRRTFPEIYDSNQRLQIDINAVRTSCQDFEVAMARIVPAAHRAAVVSARPMSQVEHALLGDDFDKAKEALLRVFDTRALTNAANTDLRPDSLGSGNASSGLSLPAFCFHRPSLLLKGTHSESGQLVVARALLQHLEGIPIHSLDLPSLLANANVRSLEEGVVHVFAQARRQVPCVVYIPELDTWVRSGAGVSNVLAMVVNNLEPSLPVLLLATVSSERLERSELWRLFERTCLCIEGPSSAGVEAILRPFEEFVLSPPTTPPVRLPPSSQARPRPLAVAPPPPPSPECRRRQLEREESVLRELRMYLREVVMMVMAERRYKDFHHLVSKDVVPDYYDVVKAPMCLTMILSRLANPANPYLTARDLMADVELLTRNAVLYNSVEDDEGARIVARAYQLCDRFWDLLEDMDEDLAAMSEEVARKRRQAGGPTEPVLSSGSVHHRVLRAAPQPEQQQPEPASSHPPAPPSPSDLPATGVDEENRGDRVNKPRVAIAALGNDPSVLVPPKSPHQPSEGVSERDLEDMQIDLEAEEVVFPREREVRTWGERVVVGAKALNASRVAELHSALTSVAIRHQTTRNRVAVLEALQQAAAPFWGRE